MPRPATGAVIEPKDGRAWALRFRACGKRHYVALGRSEDGWNREKAEAELRHVLADVERGIWQPRQQPAAVEAPAEMPTFHEFSSEWFADHEQDWRERTRTDYRSTLELYLLPWFKDFPLSAIRAEDVDRYANAKRREGKLSNNTINKTALLTFPWVK